MIDEQTKSIHIVWIVEDIITRAEDEHGYIMSENEAWKILKELYYNHDCNYGIGWDDIDSRIDDHVMKQMKGD